jgi:hypothetical protein
MQFSLQVASPETFGYTRVCEIVFPEIQELFEHHSWVLEYFTLVR